VRSYTRRIAVVISLSVAAAAAAAAMSSAAVDVMHLDTCSVLIGRQSVVSRDMRQMITEGCYYR